MKPSSGSRICCATVAQHSEITRSKGIYCRKSKPTPLSFLVGDGAVTHQMQWISDTAVVYPFGYATPLSVYLIIRHYCRVISKRHRCRSDTDLATPLSGGCFVSAVIQSKNFRHRCRVFLLCDSGVTKQLLPAQKRRVKLLTADIFHFRQKSRLLVFQAASSFIGLCVYVGLNGEVCGSFGFFYLFRAV